MKRNKGFRKATKVKRGQKGGLCRHEGYEREGERERKRKEKKRKRDHSRQKRERGRMEWQGGVGWMDKYTEREKEELLAKKENGGRGGMGCQGGVG